MMLHSAQSAAHSAHAPTPSPIFSSTSTHTTRGEARHAIQIALPLSNDLPAAPPAASASSAPQTSIQHAAAAPRPPVSPPPALDPEDAYLCAWLRSRLDLSLLPLLRLQEDSALTVTVSDQRAIWRLLRLARARSLDTLLLLATAKEVGA